MAILKYFPIMLLAASSCLSWAGGNWSAEDIQALNVAPDYHLLFLGGLFVILMQIGFAIIEGGYDPDSKPFYIFLINYLATVIQHVEK